MLVDIGVKKNWVISEPSDTVHGGKGVQTMILSSTKKSAFTTPGSTKNPIKVIEEGPKSNTLCLFPKGPLSAMGIRWMEESKIATVQAAGTAAVGGWL